MHAGIPIPLPRPEADTHLPHHPPIPPPGTRGRHPPHESRTPHPSTVHAGRYGQQVQGTHPTGMHTCIIIITTHLTSNNVKRVFVASFNHYMTFDRIVSCLLPYCFCHFSLVQWSHCYFSTSLNEMTEMTSKLHGNDIDTVVQQEYIQVGCVPPAC